MEYEEGGSASEAVTSEDGEGSRLSDVRAKNRVLRQGGAASAAVTGGNRPNASPEARLPSFNSL